ncbi:MAG: HTTM domain-containing protein [Myxococcota bacterium]|nr:HTTM domain-containing protein [Myxococcota bacterium]
MNERTLEVDTPGWWHRAWHVDEVHHSRLTALRWVIFGLIAFDLWSIMLMHAARFGAGGFNVAQIAILDTLLPTPTPAFISAGMILAGVFALFGAFGLGMRLSMSLATALYFGIYMWSQSDSYQHHYLVALLMAIACFVPQRNWSDGHLNPSERWHWAIRLIYVQVAIVYIWTAITKCDATWLSGQTMNQLTTVPEIRDIIAGFEVRWSMEKDGLYSVIAWLTMLGEFFAGAVFLIPRLRIIGLLIVPWFHVAVEVLGFDIEWFSYYMLGINFVLLTPSSVWRWADTACRRVKNKVDRERTHIQRPILQGVLLVLAATGVAASLFQLPFDLTAIVIAGGYPLTTTQMVAGIGVLYTGYVLRPSANRPIFAGQYLAAVVAACASIVTIQSADSAYDFYRMWGGDLKRRGEIDGAIDRYTMANQLHPNTPARRRQLGALHERQGDIERAKALYQEAIEVMKTHLEREAGALHSPAEVIEHIDNYLRQDSNCRALSLVLDKARPRRTDQLTQVEDCRDTALTSALFQLKSLRTSTVGHIQGFGKARTWTERALRKAIKDQQARLDNLRRGTKSTRTSLVYQFDETIRLWDRCLIGESNTVIALGRRDRKRFAQCGQKQAQIANALQQSYSRLPNAVPAETMRMQRALSARSR